MTVVSTSEIELNGQKYRIKGQVAGAWVDPFPEQMAIGDVSYANRVDVSSWVINDLRGGIGVEEMDEAVDSRVCYWTNCIIKWRNHILPPRKANSVTLPTIPVATIVNADCEATTGWTGGGRSSNYAQAGTYSWIVGASSEAYQDLTWDEDYKGCYFTFTMYIYQVTASQYLKLGINDGVDATVYSSLSTTIGSWVQLTVSKRLSTTATRVRLILANTYASGSGWFDTATLPDYPGTGNTVLFANFNSQLYCASGNTLMILNSGRTAMTVVTSFGDTITALIPSLNSRLYIYTGDSENYCYMTTAEAFTQSNSAEAYWGFQYDAKLFKVKSDGTVKYSTDPDGATPTWSTGGSINDIASEIEGFLVGRDAAGVYTPYCVTHSIIKAYDATTPQWVDTEARLPNHPIGGKGHCYWNGKLYFSYGLGVKEYYPETGSFVDIGLTERDGLPVEYNGEIVKLYGDTGLKGMFAAIDSYVTSGVSKSGLYLYDGFGWQCWWADTSNDGAMNDIIVSSAQSAYAVYWNCGGAIYYIDVPRGIENPDKISQSYATAGILITPWFDAGNPVALKLAKALDDFAKGITPTETVALKYRTDHAYTDLDSGWTTLETLNTTAETGYNEEIFASGAGLSFKAIQFRLDFVTPGSTAKPDIQNLVFYYKKRTGSEKLRTWSVTVICDNYALTSAKQKAANLKSAITSATDVLFSYHPNDDSTESYYVNVNCPGFSEETGRDYEGNYQLMLVEA